MRACNWRCALLVLISVAALVALLFVGAIPQDLDYHRFADSRSIAGVQNFWNVFSNLPFVLVGLFGLWRAWRLHRQDSHLAQRECAMAYWVLCIGIALVGLGSAYYHVAPTNATLLWDRLPMTVAFMALFYLVVSERLLSIPKPYLLWLFVAVGAASVFYWSYTETVGRGDLRPYVLVQFLPIVLMPLMLLLFERRYLRSGWLMLGFGLYVVAKLLEHFDLQLFVLTDIVVSGHALKHVVAAVAGLCIIVAVPVDAEPAL